MCQLRKEEVDRRASIQLQSYREPSTVEKVEDEIPINKVKSLTNIYLEQEARVLPFMKSFGKVIDIEEVAVYASLLYKGALCIQNMVIHERPKTEGKHLGDDCGDFFYNTLDSCQFA
jgi:hypothetical protein